jgi:hypothetical protein
VLSVLTYISAISLGLLVLPREAFAAFTSPAKTAISGGTGLLNAVDGGAGSTGWYMKAQLAAPSVVNLGALNLTWQHSQQGDFLGVKLGALNTSAPITCDGQSHVVLQLDMQSGDYSARISRIGGQSDTSAVRVEYTCTP